MKITHCFLFLLISLKVVSLENHVYLSCSQYHYNDRCCFLMFQRWGIILVNVLARTPPCLLPDIFDVGFMFLMKSSVLND
jgi:hypothetical protein